MVEEREKAPKATIDVPAEKAYFLQRTQVLQEVQEEVTRWAKWRLSILTFIVVIVGFFGVSAFVKDIVHGLLEKELGRVQKESQEVLREAVLAEVKARAITEEMTKQAEAYGKTVGTLQEKAQNVDAPFLQVKQRLESETANAKASVARDVKEMTTRVTRLEELVAKVAEVSEASRQAVNTYRKEIAELKAAAVAEAKRFAVNSEYAVTVYYNDVTKEVSAKVVERLTQAGFKASSVSLQVIAKFTFQKAPFLTPVTPGFETIPPVNSIIHTEDARNKAVEIRDFLLPAVKVRNLVELETTLRQKPVLPGMTWEFSFSKQIWVYLVERVVSS